MVQAELGARRATTARPPTETAASVTVASPQNEASAELRAEANDEEFEE
jgi:hypothetical protein